MNPTKALSLSIIISALTICLTGCSGQTSTPPPTPPAGSPQPMTRTMKTQTPGGQVAKPNAM